MSTVRVWSGYSLFGCSIYRNSALSNTAIQIFPLANALFNGKCALYGGHFQNPSNADVFIQLYDALVANVNLGTTVPTITYWVPSGGAFDLPETFQGKLFLTALTIAATTVVNGSGGAPSQGILANVFYI